MSGPADPPSLRRIREGYRAGELQPAAVLEDAEHALRRADAGEEGVNAFLATDFPAARRRAEVLVREPGWAALPLAGVPVAVKDNLATLDLPTTCGSRALEGYRSPYEATAVRRLREAGALVVGKTNLDEFAMGSSTERSAFGPTRNPLDRARVPGGSSGGSAAAVAAGIVPVALGTETGGSVRQPAALCGVVGIRPTYGRVSRYGLVAFASSLDQVGVLGRTVDDAALALASIAGVDPRDATTRPLPALLPAAPAVDGLEGVVVGVAPEYFPDSLDAGVAGCCRSALARLRSLGATVREVALPSTPLAVPAYYVLSSAEASSNLARYDGIRFGSRAADARSLEGVYRRSRARFGPEVRRRVLLGTFVLSAGYRDEYYARAQRARERVAEELDAVFRSGVHAVFTPTTPTPAFRLGERLDDPYGMYLADAFTVAASLAGIPALSLPVGRAGGLPVGGQLMGRRGDEAGLVRIARALERALAQGGDG